MTPLTKDVTKDTAEIKNQETASPRTMPAAQVPSRLRSEAVSLEIPVKVHGSCVTEVVLGVTPHTEPFEEQTTTMIVFSLGGVLKMSTPVASGQMMVLTNLKTRQDVICRVLKVRNNPNLQAYVEIEFTHAQPGYWGVFFPSDDSESAPQPASPIRPLNLEPEVKVTPAPEISRPLATSPNAQASVPAKSPVAAVPQNSATNLPAPASYAAPSSKPESAFISIGSQEDVQVAASSTVSKNAARMKSTKEDRTAGSPKKNAGAEIASASGDAFPAASHGAPQSAAGTATPEILPHIAGDPPAAHPTPILGDIGSGVAASAPSREAFGSTLGVSAAGNLAAGTGPQRNWILIAACAAVVVAVGAGGAMFFRGSSNGSSAAGNAATPSAPPSEATQNSAQNSTASQSPYSIPASSADRSTSAAVVTDRGPARTSNAIVTDHVDSTEPLAQPAPTIKSKLKGPALNSRPVAQRKARVNQADAPNLDADLTSPQATASLAGVVGSSNALPPPPTALRVGGAIQAPKLISSVAPVYPSAATQAMLDGDVVIHAVIDKNGNVTQATAVSGPSMLQSAAVTAVRRWKYAPSLLDGQPIASDVTVTLKFHH